MISCSASEAGENISWSISASGVGGASREISIGMSGVISLSRIFSISEQGRDNLTLTFHGGQTSTLVGI